tara:strand:- start:254 stop:862 length:609 start_codon:yes stop_codon:yes gene_type:complete
MKLSSKEVDLGLVKRAKARDYKAFDLLVLKYQSRLISTAYNFVKDEQIAEDIVQESFIKSFKSLNSFREDSSFYTWIYRITVNTTKNFLVSKKRKDELLNADLSEASVNKIEIIDSDSPEGIITALQLEEIILKSIDNLGEETKTAFTLREFEGLSYEQIAEVVKCPVGTVRSRIFRARELIDRSIREFKDSNQYLAREVRK